MNHQQNRQCTLNVTLKRFRATNVVVEKQYELHFSECVVVDLGIQHAMRMCRTAAIQQRLTAVL
jgi:hypothetical protein